MNMRYLILIFSILISIQLLGQNSQPKIDLVNDKDEIIDTIGVDGRKYIRFYREATTDILDLDFDDYPDTIIWYSYLEQSIERSVAFYDPGMQIKIRNRHGELKLRGDWERLDKELIKFSDTLKYKFDRWVTYSKLDSRSTGMTLAHQLYASDPDSYTIISIDSLSKPRVLYDSVFYLTNIEDVDKNGYLDFVGKENDYGQVRPSDMFVPFQVLTYKNKELVIDYKLSYKYNYPLKKYRKYPEGSITILTEQELKKYNKEDLRIMRNEIFADYGYIFSSKEMKEYFTSQDWYKPTGGLINNLPHLVTDWERKNIGLIKHMENQ